MKDTKTAIDYLIHDIQEVGNSCFESIEFLLANSKSTIVIVGNTTSLFLAKTNKRGEKGGEYTYTLCSREKW